MVARTTKTLEGDLFFPLQNTEEAVENGAIYEVKDGKAVKVASGVAPTSDLIGVAVGGNNVEKGKVLLTVNPLMIFKEDYTVKPTLGSYVDGCKLVVEIDEDKQTFKFLLRKQANA